MSIYIINALRLVFNVNPHTSTIRKDIDKIMSDNPDRRDIFISYITKKMPDIHTVIREALTAYVELMGFDPLMITTYTDEYIEGTMWLFFTRIVYERPILLLPDTINGNNLDIIRDSMEYYLSEQVKINK